MSEWIEWTGGKCPVPKETMVVTEWYDCNRLIGRADSFPWGTRLIVRYQAIGTQSTDERIDAIERRVAEIERRQMAPAWQPTESGRITHPAYPYTVGEQHPSFNAYANVRGDIPPIV